MLWICFGGGCCCPHLQGADPCARLPCWEGQVKEWMALTINWVSDEIDHCHVGFLPDAFIHQARVWDGVLYQVVQVIEKDNQSKVCRAKWQKNKGYAHVTVITDEFLQTNWRCCLPDNWKDRTACNIGNIIDLTC